MKLDSQDNILEAWAVLKAEGERREFWTWFAALFAAVLVSIFFVWPAFAQTAVTDQVQVIPAQPWVMFLKPYIDIVVQSAVVALAGLAFAKFQKITGIQMSASQVASLKSAAATEAGVLVANAADNLSKQSITVSDPRVAAAANRIAAALPDAAGAVGASPAILQKFVVGELGKLQASATPTVVMPVTTVPVPTAIVPAPAAVPQ